MNDIYVPIKKYVYFDDSGNLLSINNTNTEPGNYLESTFSEVENLITGKEQYYHYYVLFDTIKKTYVLKHKFNEEEIFFNINEQIFQVDRKKVKRPDLKIVQDCKNRCWKFSLDKSIKDNFKNKKISFGKNLQFSITQYNDPHQLERFISIEFSLLINKTISIPFLTDNELDPTQLSVYTIKRLETYSHEVING